MLILLAAVTAYSQEKVRVGAKDRLKYVWIPAGSFQMGCSEGDNSCEEHEKPVRAVRLTRGFWLGQTEVTVAAYKSFAKAAGKAMPDEPVLRGRPLNLGWANGTMPIVAVTWDEAR